MNVVVTLVLVASQGVGHSLTAAPTTNNSDEWPGVCGAAERRVRTAGFLAAADEVPGQLHGRAVPEGLAGDL